MLDKTEQETTHTSLPEMIYIEGGSFNMGSNDYDREKPIHKVTISPFLLSQFPITNQQYAAFLRDYQNDTIKNGAHEVQKMIYEHRFGIQKVENTWQSAKGFEKSSSYIRDLVWCDSLLRLVK